MQLFSDLNKKFFAQSLSWKLLIIALMIFPVIPPVGVAIILWLIIKIWLKKWQFIKHQKNNFLPLLIIIWLIISSLIAEDKGEAFLGIANLLPFFLMFVAIKQIVQKIDHLKIISFSISFSSILLVCLGLGQLYLGWHTGESLSFLTGSNLTLNGVPPKRISSIFLHANIFSLYLSTSFILTLGLLLSKFGHPLSLFKIIKKITKKERKLVIDKEQIWFILIIIFDLIGLILSNSRNGWLIACFAIISFALYYRFYEIIAIFLVSGIATAWASFGNLPAQNWFRKIVPDFIWLRLSDQMFDDRPLATLRTTQWNFSLDMIANRPVFGWGLRSFSRLYQAEYDFYLGHPHNLFLMFGAEIGIIGLLLLLIWVSSIFFQAIKTIKICQQNNSQGIILFSYLICFTGFIIFNFFDVSIFDFRLNTIGWLILASIAGVSEERI